MMVVVMVKIAVVALVEMAEDSRGDNRDNGGDSRNGSGEGGNGD